MTTKQLGAWIIALGAFSILLSFVGLRFRYLWFLDELGSAASYALKAGLIGVGVLIFRNTDRVPLDHDAAVAEGKRSPWIHVALSVALILGVMAFLVVRMVNDSRDTQQLQRPPVPATWASKPVEDWPPVVLLQRAAFKNHSPMFAGCACLIRLPTGDIAALTPGHLLGKAGGVSPGFLHRGFGGLDRSKLATLDREIDSWKLFLPDDEDQTLDVVGLFGKADQFDEDCDQLLLRLPLHAKYPAMPLNIRLRPVELGEPLRVIRCELEGDSFHQVVQDATRIPGLMFTCRLEQPANLNGCSGAPVVDKDGLLVAIVTGGTLLDLGNPSNTVRAFSGHPISELLPVFKAALHHKEAASISGEQPSNPPRLARSSTPSPN